MTSETETLLAKSGSTGFANYAKQKGWVAAESSTRQVFPISVEHLKIWLDENISRAKRNEIKFATLCTWFNELKRNTLF